MDVKLFQRQLSELIERRISEAPFLIVNHDTIETNFVTAAVAAALLTEQPFDIVTVVDLKKSIDAMEGFSNDRRRIFDVHDICKITGAKTRTVHQWVQDGTIQASYAGRRGQGNELQFTWHDAWWSGVMASLRRAGVSHFLCDRILEGMYQTQYEESTKVLAERERKAMETTSGK